MNCDDARRLLLDEQYGELDDAARAQLDAHAADCPACREHAEGLRRRRNELCEDVVLGDHVVTPSAELLDGCTHRRGSRSDVAAGLASVCIPDEQRRDTGEARRLAERDVEREKTRYGRVERVPASLEHVDHRAGRPRRSRHRNELPRGDALAGLVPRVIEGHRIPRSLGQERVGSGSEEEDRRESGCRVTECSSKRGTCHQEGLLLGLQVVSACAGRARASCSTIAGCSSGAAKIDTASSSIPVAA